MEVARDLACLTRRRMAQDEVADSELGHGSAAQGQRDDRVVAASDPDPAPRTGQGAEAVVEVGGELAAAVALVEAVAEADHDVRAQAVDQSLQALQRGVAVIGRQQAAAAGEGAAFLQMQVGHDEHRPARQEYRAGGVKVERFALELQSHEAAEASPPWPPRPVQPPPRRAIRRAPRRRRTPCRCRR